ncbi:MAG: tryptophan synthase subunit alpha [Candidatus Anaerobiospirillum merdipullorum]|uniref:Tryptophan synthase alpha chain n=1 Tax=Candidatus Anaerobiospirillum merdipullorum TaxID=2838450 RepID=A0A9E2KNH3_9GAMM|nr:tryptophan synthase subunit alpha [Candidatus Anaerobiospirillum merdipullorum]
MTTRFATMFANLKAKHEGAFVPFVTLCDPNFDTSVKILHTLCASGADALELGLPFSDPCADGPVIQDADKRALSAGSTTQRCFDAIAKLRASYDAVPISLLVYVNLVVAFGTDRFFAQAAAAGVDAVLLADVPVNMLDAGEDFRAAASRHGIELVLIAPSNASKATLAEIAEKSEGYIYTLSRFGITGTDKVFGRPVDLIAHLKELKAAPTLLGFGISTPDHVKIAMQCGADGAISGSAIVKIIGENLDNEAAMLENLHIFVQKMKAATKEQ